VSTSLICFTVILGLTALAPAARARAQTGQQFFA
jgi:hypothetical protein